MTRGKQPPPRPITRQMRSRREKERRLQRGAIIFGSVAILSVILVVVFGYYFSMVRPYRDWIIKVNDTTYSYGYYLKILRMTALGSVTQGEQPDLSTQPFQLVELLEDSELIRQAAPRLGIAVSEEELTQELRVRIMGEPPKDADPAQLEREFRENLRQRLNAMQLSEGEYRVIVRADLLREKLTEQLAVRVPAVAEQVHLYALLAQDQAKAEEAKKKLEAGESFATVATEFSVDESLKEKEGDLGWVPRGVNPGFDDLLFGLAEGEVGQPVEGEGGYYLIKVLERKGTQVHLQGLLLPDRDKAYEALVRHNGGEAIELLAQELSIDPELKEKRGDMGWLSPGDKGGVFDEAVFGLGEGKVSEPLPAAQGAYLVKVGGREAARQIDDQAREQLKLRELDRWLLEERGRNRVLRNWDSEKYAWVVDQIMKEVKKYQQ